MHILSMNLAPFHAAPVLTRPRLRLSAYRYPLEQEELRTLERKLVVLLEEQQRELESIRRRQEKKGVLLLKASAADDSGGGAGGTFGSVGGGGPSAKDKRQAAQLMQSTETLMKFGFMSMSMTYFSSLNMIRAMRSVGASDTVMAALAHNSNIAEARSQASGGGGGGSAGGGGDDSRALALEQNEKLGTEPFRPALKPGQLPGQEPLAVSAWSVDDVARWLQVSVLFDCVWLVHACIFNVFPCLHGVGVGFTSIILGQKNAYEADENRVHSSNATRIRSASSKRCLNPRRSHTRPFHSDSLTVIVLFTPLERTSLSPSSTM